jgi:hypothetical protein
MYSLFFFLLSIPFVLFALLRALRVLSLLIRVIRSFSPTLGESKRILFQIIKGFQFDVDIDIFPAEVRRGIEIDFEYFIDRDPFEHGKVGKRDEVFFVGNDQPDSVLINICYFTERSARSIML